MQQTLEGLLVGSTLLHFYYDGFIWKVREKATRSAMGLKGGKAVPTGRAEGTPAWLAHAAKWSIFAVPLALLGASEPAKRDGLVVRAESLAETLPKNAYAQKHWGDTLRDLGRNEDALVQYESARELGMDSYTLQHNIGVMLTHLGRPEEASVTLEGALALRETPDTHTKLGNVRFSLGDREGARESWEAALAQDPTIAEAHHGLGRYYTETGDLPRAVASYREALALNPGADATRFNLAAVLEATGDPAGAEAVRAETPPATAPAESAAPR